MNVAQLSDYPTDASFAAALPAQYADALRAFPFTQYTSPSAAAAPMNLATYLPASNCPPDLGPKMYAANSECAAKPAKHTQACSACGTA